MSRRSQSTKIAVALLAACLFIFATATPAIAQYGGISGLFVASDGNTSKQADFSGLGCESGAEVVLYLPDIDPSPTDPVANQSVPGRIIAVTTALTDANSLINGSFTFQDAQLPSTLDADIYQINSRCGLVDLSVLVRVTEDCEIIPIATQTNPDRPDSLAFASDGFGGFLPFTGSSPSRFLSLVAGLIAAGFAAISFGRREPAQH